MNENNYLLRVHNNSAKSKLLKRNLKWWKDTLDLSTSNKHLCSSRYRIRRAKQRTSRHRRQIDDNKDRIPCNKLQRHVEYDTLGVLPPLQVSFQDIPWNVVQFSQRYYCLDLETKGVRESQCAIGTFRTMCHTELGRRGHRSCLRRIPPFPQSAWQQTFLRDTFAFCAWHQTSAPRVRLQVCLERNCQFLWSSCSCFMLTYYTRVFSAYEYDNVQ